MPDTGKKTTGDSHTRGGARRGLPSVRAWFGAARMQLFGYVLNTTAGVVAEVEGAGAALDDFVRATRRSAAAGAHRRDDGRRDAAERDCDFVIRESQAQEGAFALVSADMATCAECYGAVSHVRGVPGGVARSGNRRFHAQPNGCAACGPQLSAPIGAAQRRLQEGAIPAMRGLGGFHLACDPRNDATVRLLRARERRSDKPFALMARDVAAVEAFCVVSEEDRIALTSPRRPIVILPRKADSGLPACTRELARNSGLPSVQRDAAGTLKRRTEASH